MNGNSRIILQERDLHLFRELSVMRIADRGQLMIAAGFGSTTRANRRLRALSRTGFLRRFFLGFSGARKALYVLSPKGAATAGVPRRGPRRPQETMLVADYFTEHQLTINELYCTLKFRPIPDPRIAFHRWQSFHEAVAAGVNLIPDGYVEFMTPAGIAACFLEVDLGHESRTVWKEKTRRYIQLALSGEFAQTFGQERFRVLVVTRSERKLHSIRKAVAEITQKIFWFAPLAMMKDSFFAPVWLRPTENSQQSLFDEPP